MKITLTSLIAVTLATSIATNATAGTKITFNDGLTVENAVSGNSVVGQLSDGTSYCEYHDPNSAVFGRDYEVYAGNWQVRNNYICYAYPGLGTDCQRARVKGSRITYKDAGDGHIVAKGTIVPGNVCS